MPPFPARWTDSEIAVAHHCHAFSTPSGKPVADAIVRLGALGRPNGKSPSFETCSHCNKAYALDDVSAGNWMLTCRVQGHITTQTNVFMPVLGGDVVHEFQLDSDPRVETFMHLRALRRVVELGPRGRAGLGAVNQTRSRSISESSRAGGLGVPARQGRDLDAVSPVDLLKQIRARTVRLNGFFWR
jgi:hypothetical protein